MSTHQSDSSYSSFLLFSVSSYFTEWYITSQLTNHTSTTIISSNLYLLFSVFSSADGAYEIADVDRKTFFTKAGRPVKDGGGNYEIRHWISFDVFIAYDFILYFVHCLWNFMYLFVPRNSTSHQLHSSFINFTDSYFHYIPEGIEVDIKTEPLIPGPAETIFLTQGKILWWRWLNVWHWYLILEWTIRLLSCT